MHITGAAHTFDAIVWGPATGEGAADDRTAPRRDRPKLKKPITAELGGVSPIIIVPGAWTEADLRFQAEHVATMRLQNAGHNCIAGQVVIPSADWPQREAFLDALRTAYEAAPQRSVWYPRSDEKLSAAASDYPDAVWCADGTRALVEIGADGDATALESHGVLRPRARGRVACGQRAGVPGRRRRARQREAGRAPSAPTCSSTRRHRPPSATASSVRSPTCATARSRSTPGRPSAI